MGKAEGREGARPGSQRVGQAPISAAAAPSAHPAPAASTASQFKSSRITCSLECSKHTIRIWNFSSVMCRHLVPGTDLSQRMEDGNSEGRA